MPPTARPNDSTASSAERLKRSNAARTVISLSERSMEASSSIGGASIVCIIDDWPLMPMKTTWTRGALKVTPSSVTTDMMQGDAG